MFQPKYMTVKTVLLDRIAAQQYTRHQPVPSEEKLAREFGVAGMTVRRAIQELVSEGILYRMRGRGHGTFVCDATPDPNCARHAIGKLKRIALLHSSDWKTLRSGATYFRIFLELQAACSSQRVGIQFMSADQFQGQTLIERINHQHCQCVTVLDWYKPAVLLQIQNSGIPVIVLGPFQEMECLSFICANDFLAACMVTRYLQKIGHERVAFVRTRKIAKISRDRESGWQMAMRYSDESVEKYSYTVGRQLQGTGEAIEEMCTELKHAFAHKPPPSAILARDGFVARAVLASLRELGRRCPEDISVACIGNSFEPEPNMPVVTTVHLAPGLLGQTALKLSNDLLQRRLQGPIGMELAPLVSVGQTTRAVSRA